MGVEFILKQDGVHPDVWEMEGDLDGIDEAAFLTFDEIVDDIVANRLSSGAEEDLVTCPEEDLCMFHLSFGMWIRNSYGLWLKGNPLTNDDDSHVRNGIDYNPMHPDEVSFKIMSAVHKKLTGCDTQSLANTFDDAMSAVTKGEKP